MKNIKTNTENAKIKSIVMTVMDEGTQADKEIILLPTNQLGVFACKGWENNGLRDLIDSKAFGMVLLNQPVDGEYNGFSIHIPNLMKQVAPDNHAALTELAKLICIAYQSALTPALAYAKDFDLNQYTPTKHEVCKGCTMKRRCLFYKANTKEV